MTLLTSMLKRIGVGLVFSLFTTIYSVIMLTCKNYFLFDITSYKVVIVSEVLYGTATIPTTLAFTIAQTPREMRGLMVGLWYAARGVGYILNINGKFVFECENDTTSHCTYYFIVKSGITFIILIMFLVQAKHYEFHVRENEVNIYIIAVEQI